MVYCKSENVKPSDGVTDRIRRNVSSVESQKRDPLTDNASASTDPQLSRVHQPTLEGDDLCWIKLAQGEIDPWACPILWKRGNHNSDPWERANTQLESWNWDWVFEDGFVLVRQGDSVYLGLRIDAPLQERGKWRRYLADALDAIPDRPSADEPIPSIEGLQIEDLTAFAPEDLAWPGVGPIGETAYVGEPLTLDEILDRALNCPNLPDLSSTWLAAMMSDCGHSEQDAIAFLTPKNDTEIVRLALGKIQKGYGRVSRAGVEMLRFILVTGEQRQQNIEQLASVPYPSISEIQEWNAVHCEPPLSDHEIRGIIAKVNHDAGRLPPVTLPGGAVTISSTGSRLGGLLDQTGRYYNRGGAPVRLIGGSSDDPSLQILKPANLPSSFEEVAKLFTVTKKGELIPATCSEAAAKLIYHAESFLGALSPIELISLCPVVIERNKKIVQVVCYDRESGILAMGQPLPDISLDEATRLIGQIVQDFRFATPSDRSRALAAIITPAMVQGGLLKGRAPLDLGEADQSQTGKGFRNKLTAAVYRQKVQTVSQRKGGVGGLEEDFNTRLVQGGNFIALDNIRGQIDSPAIESFLTEDTYIARIPFQPAVSIDPRRHVVLMTTNKAEVTPDLANRSSCVRILKQPETYQFTRYAEGGILHHIRANQPRYLAAVFAIVKEWYRKGKPQTDESRHDFREWARTLDWIVQHILGEPPLIDGHKETKARMTNPHLGWLREVAISVDACLMAGAWLRPNELVDMLDRGGVEIPGKGGNLEDESNRKKAFQAIGSRLSRCFTGVEDSLTIDQWTIERREVPDENYRTRREYKFSTNRN